MEGFYNIVEVPWLILKQIKGILTFIHVLSPNKKCLNVYISKLIDSIKG
jgi:hypothetical protein